MNKGLVILFEVYLTAIRIYANRRCLECNAVTQPFDCTTVTECGDREICFMEKYVTNGGIVLFDVGCRDPYLCNANHAPFGKRQVPSNLSEVFKRSTMIATTLCYQCCDDKDMCNLDHHCGAQTFKPPTGSRICYSCQMAAQPDSCNQITICDHDSFCSVRQVTNLLGYTRWETGCTPKTQCTQDSMRNSQKLCSYCCGDNLCNTKCPIVSTPVSHPATRTTTSAVPGAPPTITSIDIKPPNPKYGDNVLITCHANGSPPINYQFMVAAHALAVNAHANQNILNFTNYNTDDDKTYRCNATNTFGSDYKQFSMHGHN